MSGIEVYIRQTIAKTNTMPDPPAHKKLTGHTAPVYVVEFLTTKPYFVSGSFDQTLKLWDTATLEPFATFGGHTDLVLAVAIAPGDKLFASGSQDKTVKLWELPAEPPPDPNAPLKPTGELKGHAAQVYAVAFSPDGKLLVSASADKTVRLWDVAAQTEIRALPEQGGPVYSVAFSPDGKSLLTGGGDKTVRLYDVADGKELRQFEAPQDAVYSVAFSPDGKTAVAGGLDKTVSRWNVDDGATAGAFDGARGDVYRVQFNHDGGKLMAVTYAADLAIWNTADAKLLFQTELPGRTTYSGAWSPEGRQIAIAAEDGNVYLLNLPDSAQ